MPAPDCTIVIPNYNGESMLRQNLSTVQEAADHYPGQCNIVLVDDASADNSIDYVRALAPTIQICEHSHNQGFARAIHTGVTESDTELLMFVNTDVQLSPECLTKLAAAFADPTTFAVSPVILDQRNKPLPSTWIRPRLRRGHIASNSWSEAEISQSSAHKLRTTLYCSGGSVMVRRSMFAELGGFATLFEPFYSEDFDLALRAWYRGWRSLVSTSCRVVHFDKGSIATHYEQNYVKRIQRRNRLLLEWLHLPVSYLMLVNLPFVGLQLLGELLLFDRKNIMGFADAVRRAPEVLNLRKKIHRQGDRSLKDVLRLVNSS